MDAQYKQKEATQQPAPQFIEMPAERIVAEVCRNWNPDKHPSKEKLLSQNFEHVIEVNRARGYALEDWHMTSVFNTLENSLTETIVAVFKRIHES